MSLIAWFVLLVLVATAVAVLVALGTMPDLEKATLEGAVEIRPLNALVAQVSL
jgi:hypothetical protein